MNSGWKNITPGPPPDEWRCKRIKRNGERCKMWSLSDPRHPIYGGGGTSGGKNVPLGRCRMHSGRLPKPLDPIDNTRLPMFYQRRLTKTLKKAVQESLGRTNAEQIALYEELALVREAAGQAVQNYGEAADLQADFESAISAGKKISEQDFLAVKSVTSEAAGQMVAELKNVEHFASAIAKIEAASKDNVTIHLLNSIVHQTVRLFYEVCGVENIALAQRFEKLMKDKIVLPSQMSNATGTTITPDMDVLEMDGLIPKN